MKMLCLALLIAIPARAENKPALRPEDGGLPADAINRAIQERITFIHACYTDELKKKKTLGEGKVKTKLVIGGDGKVKNAEAVASFGSHRVETCIENELRSLQFTPPVGGGTVEVSYPFSFHR